MSVVTAERIRVAACAEEETLVQSPNLKHTRERSKQLYRSVVVARKSPQTLTIIINDLLYRSFTSDLTKIKTLLRENYGFYLWSLRNMCWYYCKKCQGSYGLVVTIVRSGITIYTYCITIV